MAFNIIDNIYNMYTKRFPNASLDNFLTYIKRNHPNQYKYAQQLVEKARDYKVATENEVKDFLKEAPQKAEQKATEFKKAIDTKARQAKQVINNNAKAVTNNAKTAVKGTVNNLTKNAVSMEQALAREGLKKTVQAGTKAAASAGAKAGIKGALGSIAGPAISGALALPTTIKGLTDKNATPLSQAYDLLGLGSAIGIGAAPGLYKIPAFMGSVLFPMASNAMRNNNGDGTPDINNNSLKPLTPEERQHIANNADATLLQAQQQSNEMQDAINWYDNYNNRMQNNLDNAINDTLNLRPPTQSLTPVNRQGNTNYPVTNLPPVNGQSNIANNNSNNMVNNNMSNTTNNPQFNNNVNNLLNNIQALSSYTKGMQQGNQLPNLGVTPEEFTAYQNALEVYGKNVSQANKDIEAYKQALLRDQNVNSMIRMMGSAGNVISNLQPKQNMYTFNQQGQFVGVGAPDATNYNDVVDRAVRTPGMSDRIKQQYELNEMMRKNEAENATRFADLLANARLSNETGLPIQVVKAMEAGDYLDYIQPIQDRNTKAQELALTGVSNLIQDAQQQDADLAKAMAIADSNYTTEQLKQLNENQRAVLEANLKTQMNALDNSTKMKAMQLAGYNQLELEKLRQKDPNAYLRAQGQILQAAALYGGQVGALGQNMLFNIFNNMNGTNAQPVSQSDAVNNYMQNVFK
jgi:hypothetical protein|nr:MAG TPA: hypothetical protein [Caudoviricetes sp.]